jgi:hypothetical protein
MNLPTVKPISAEERKLWEKHNIDTLREWRAIPFTKKIQMVEEMEELARSMHGGNLPESPSEREQQG